MKRNESSGSDLTPGNEIVSFTKNTSFFALDVLKLVSGTAIAQAICVLISPIITRLYSPEDFGLNALFASIVVVSGAIACMQYELAIMLPKNDKAAANLLALSLLCAISFSILIIPIILLAVPPLLDLLKIPNLVSYIWLIPLSTFFSGAFQALNYWNSRTKHFGRLSIARVISSVATTCMQLGAGFLGCATGGSLIIAGLLGSTLSTILLGGQIVWDEGGMLRKYINWNDMVAGLKRYKRFPIFSSWGTLLNTASWQLPTFLLSAFFSSTIVGYYALSMMVLQLPASLIGGAISQVFFQRAAEAKFDNTLPQVIEYSFLRLAIIGGLPMVILALTGKEIFIVIFGVAWAEAGIYAQILAPWIFLFFVTSPICPVFCVLEEQSISLLFNIILFGTRATALILGGLSGNVMITITLFAIVGIVDYGGLGLCIFHKIGISKLRFFRQLSLFAVYCILAFGLIALGKWVLLLSPQTIILLDILTMIPYYILFIKKEGSFDQMMLYIKNHQI